MAANPVTIESGVALRLTISAGVAVLPEDGSWLERLSVAADRSLDAAKRGGRNRVMTRAKCLKGLRSSERERPERVCATRSFDSPGTGKSIELRA